MELTFDEVQSLISTALEPLREDFKEFRVETKGEIKEIRDYVSDIKHLVNPKIVRYGEQIKDLEDKLYEHKTNHKDQKSQEISERNQEISENRLKWSKWSVILWVALTLVNILVAGLTVYLQFA